MLQNLKHPLYYRTMAAEESDLTVEAFLIACIFRKEDLSMIGARVKTAEKEFAPNSSNE